MHSATPWLPTWLAVHLWPRLLLSPQPQLPGQQQPQVLAQPPEVRAPGLGHLHLRARCGGPALLCSEPARGLLATWTLSRQRTSSAKGRHALAWQAAGGTDLVVGLAAAAAARAARNTAGVRAAAAAAAAAAAGGSTSAAQVAHHRLQQALHLHSRGGWQHQ
jgi:hypothetical protein